METDLTILIARTKNRMGFLKDDRNQAVYYVFISPLQGLMPLQIDAPGFYPGL